MRCTLLLTSAGLLIGAGAVAKPLNRNWTPAAAPWLVHVDVEAAMRSEIGKLGFEGPEPVLAELSAEMQEELGFDFFSEVRSVTIYGLTVDHEEPVVIISTTPEAEARLVAMAAEMAESTVVEQNRTIYKMGPDDGEHSHYGAFLAGPDANERLIVISPVRAKLHGAIDIIEGKGRLEANLDQSPLTRGPAAGSIVFVSASEIDKGLDIAPVALVLQRAEGMRFDMGEVNGEMYLDADLRTTGDDEAQQMFQMAQGGIAMAQFAASKEPEFAEIAALAGGMKLQVDGRDLSLRFRHDSKDLMRRITDLTGEIHVDHDDDDHDHDGDHHVEVHHTVKVGKDGKIQE